MSQLARSLRVARLLPLTLPALLLATRATAGTPCLVEEAKLVAGDAEAEDWYGIAVALDAGTALVGASREDAAGADAGAAYVQVHDGSAWTEQAKLVASDGGPGQRFGTSVTVEGDTAVVGAYGASGAGSYSGAVYVFARSGSTWSEEVKLVASDAAAGDLFGWSVSLDGDTLLVGAYGDDDAGDFSGAAYVFAREGGVWTEQAKLLPDDGAPDSWFGASVSVEGDTALVGASRDDEAAANAGAAYVFVREGTSWTQQAKLTLLDAQSLDFAGGSVSLSGETALVGAFGGNDSGPYSGAAYVFVREGASWSQQAKLLPEDGHVDDFFGESVALSGHKAVIGAYGHDEHGTDAGALYVFDRHGTSWQQEVLLFAGDAAERDWFGLAVALDGDTALAGAIRDDDAGSESGSAYVFGFPPPLGTPYCACPAGPCGNSDRSQGCANSTGAGAGLLARGTTQPDDVHLFVTGAPPGQFAIFFQGDEAVAIPFGDGFRCASGNVVRVTRPAIVTAPDGTASFGPCFGDETISSITGAVPGSGETKRYQFWYRDPAGPCSTTFNLSDGVEIVW